MIGETGTRRRGEAEIGACATEMEQIVREDGPQHQLRCDAGALGEKDTQHLGLVVKTVLDADVLQLAIVKQRSWIWARTKIDTVDDLGHDRWLAEARITRSCARDGHFVVGAVTRTAVVVSVEFDRVEIALGHWRCWPASRPPIAQRFAGRAKETGSAALHDKSEAVGT